MPDSFAYLTSGLIRSTIWDQSSDVRVLWITMLALKDKEGCVWASVPGLAHEARLTIPVVEEALGRFQSPDPYSRTKKDEGRRIRTINGGWQLINHGKYRLRRDPEKRREQNLQAKRRQRAKQRGGQPESQPSQPESAHQIRSDQIMYKEQLPCRADARRPCDVCRKTLLHLNDRMVRRYELKGQTRQKIHACHTRASQVPEKALDACCSVIDWLYDAWQGTEMETYLRPSTIFRPSKFQQYWEEIQAGAPPPRKEAR